VTVPATRPWRTTGAQVLPPSRDAASWSGGVPAGMAPAPSESGTRMTERSRSLPSAPIGIQAVGATGTAAA
jgi:hypothetical protein